MINLKSKMVITLYLKIGQINMSFKSVKQILAAIKNKEVSASELTSNYLERIKKHDSLNCL